MEGIDAKMAARVWQRVKAPEQPAQVAGRSLSDMLFQSHGLAGLYQGLQRRMTGAAAARARELYHRQERLSACLKGMILLSGSPIPALPPMVPGTGSLRSILEGCCHRERRLLAGLSGGCPEENPAPVFHLLAEQTVQRIATVLELLGDLP